MSPPVPRAVRRTFLILHNPLSGRDRTRYLAAVLDTLGAAGATVTVEAPAEFSRIAARAAEARATATYDAIVAAGGDGTIRSVAGALAGTPTPLGVIPLGTANVLAAELRLPRSPGEIARTLLHGGETTIGCGLANGAPFLLMAGAGFDAAVLARLDHAWKHKVGKLAYLGPGLGALMQRPRRFEALIDGRPRACTWLIVANAGRYAGSFLLAPGRDIAAQGFDAVVVTAPTRARLLGVLLAIAAGRTTFTGDAEIIQCREVEVPAAARIPIQIDGDLASASALHIAPAKVPLTLIVPERPRTA